MSGPSLAFSLIATSSSVWLRYRKERTPNGSAWYGGLDLFMRVEPLFLFRSFQR